MRKIEQLTGFPPNIQKRYENMSRAGLLNRIEKLEATLSEISKDSADPGIQRVADEACNQHYGTSYCFRCGTNLPESND